MQRELIMNVYGRATMSDAKRQANSKEFRGPYTKNPKLTSRSSDFLYYASEQRDTPQVAPLVHGIASLFGD